MTAMICKSRMRRALALGPISASGILPNGVGGMPTKEPCYEFMIGDYHVYLTASTLKKLIEDWRMTAASIDGPNDITKILSFVP